MTQPSNVHCISSGSFWLRLPILQNHDNFAFWVAFYGPEGGETDA